MNNPIVEISQKIIEQVREEHDKFIFETIYPYCQEHTKMVISKKILCRALEWYKKEHLDEYTELAKEVEDEHTNRTMEKNNSEC